MKIKESLTLYEKIKELNPKHILELGTGIGCSTEFMAFACPKASITTVESDDKCIELAKVLIPEVTQERIYFRQSKVRLSAIYEVDPFVEWLSYDDYPQREYDFILVDGPGPTVLTKKHPVTGKSWEGLAELPGADIIFLLPRMKEGIIVYVDGRRNLINLALRHLQGYLEVIEDRGLYKDHTGKEFPLNYTIFKRNSKTLKDDLSDFVRSDTFYTTLKENGYFDKL